MQKSLSPAGPRSRRSIRLGAIVLAFGLLAAACGSSSESSSNTINLGQEPLSPSVDDVQPATPDVGTLDVPFATFDGGTTNLDKYVGKPLVVNFFAAWCPNCVSEMPDFEAVHQEIGDSVNIVGLSIDSAAADALALIDRTGVTYDTGWDPKTNAYTVFGGFAMPTTVFIDSSGTVVEVFSGALNADALRKKIEQIT